MSQNKLDLAELRRLVEAMTPAPWNVERGNLGPKHPWFIQTTEDGDGLRLDCDENTLGVHAIRNAAPQLLTIAEAAQAYCNPGRHAHDCTKGRGMPWEPEYPCSCGLDALRKALEGEDSPKLPTHEKCPECGWSWRRGEPEQHRPTPYQKKPACSRAALES